MFSLPVSTLDYLGSSKVYLISPSKFSRISKSETNPKFEFPKREVSELFGTFDFFKLVLVSKFARLREAAPAKAGISCFEF